MYSLAVHEYGGIRMSISRYGDVVDMITILNMLNSAFFEYATSTRLVVFDAALSALHRKEIHR